MSEAQAAEHIQNVIRGSLLNYRTQLYDIYQWNTNSVWYYA